MLVFIADDSAYHHWVTHHRRGFVIDGRRQSGWGQLVLHRASCPHVRTRPDRRTHWTTAGKFKACAHTRDELQVWAIEETGTAAALCAECQPLSDVATIEHSPEQLTKLAAEILDYVLESATIHLENEYPPYRLRVGDIAACFAKTPGQLAAAFQQLTCAGWLEIVGPLKSAHPKPQQKVLPTTAALRTLAAYRETSDTELLTELHKLRVT